MDRRFRNDRIIKRWASNLNIYIKDRHGWAGDDQFGYIAGICTDGTYLWISDLTNNRVMKRLASDLSYVSKATLSETAGLPEGICFDGKYLYITDGGYINKRWASNLTYVKIVLN